MGQAIATMMQTTAAPTDVIQDATSVFAGANGYGISAASQNMVSGTRTFIPTWAWIVAFVGIPFTFFLSLLFLLKKDTESITVTTKADPATGNTVVNVTGAGSNDIIGRLQAMTQGFPDAG